MGYKSTRRQLSRIAARHSGARAQWAKRINAAWQKSAAAIIETGNLLIAAKAKLEHGTWEAMVESDLKFSARTAQMLMEIGRDRRLAKAKISALLPPAWTTIHAISKLSDQQLKARIADGTICADMGAKDITTEAKQTRRAERERDLAQKIEALPKQKFGVILADCEWRFEPWSRETGLDRAADNHYPTSCTEIIAARDVPSIAADDCVLFLWATAPMLPHALVVMAAWGFNYCSQQIWKKNRTGTGYWFRNEHEILLLGTKGNVPAPAPGKQWKSVVEAEVGKHSAKPEIFLQMIEQYFPTLPKIELNRRGPARDGWTPWGNEAQRAA